MDSYKTNNRLMNACYLLYSRSSEFLELIYTFNIDVGVCFLVCVKSNVFNHFSGIVNS